MKKFLSDSNLFSEQPTNDVLKLIEKGNWSVIIVTDSMPMPTFIVKLSELMNCKIITLGYDDTVGAFHYSEVENKMPTKIYTYIEGICEKQGLTLVDVYNTAINKKQFSIEPGFKATEDNLEYGSEGFFSAYSEIDLLPIVYGSDDSIANEEEIYLVGKFPYKAYGDVLDLESNTWNALL